MKRLFLCAPLLLWGCAPQAGSDVAAEAVLVPPERAVVLAEQLPIEAAPATLQLRELLSGAAGERRLRLDYFRRDDQVGPRAVELRLEVGSGLHFESARPLEAVRSAGKRLLVQREDDALRLMVFGTGNVERLDSGGIAELRFVRRSGGDDRVALRWAPPFFAPLDANRGLVPPSVVVAISEQPQ